MRAYTVGAAYAGTTSGRVGQGSFSPGKVADLLAHGPFTADPAAIPQTRLTATLVVGTVVAGEL